MKYEEISAFLLTVPETEIDLKKHLNVAKAKLYIDVLGKALKMGKAVASPPDAAKHYQMITKIISDILLCEEQDVAERDAFVLSFRGDTEMFKYYKFETNEKYMNDLKGFLTKFSKALLSWKDGAK